MQTYSAFDQSARWLVALACIATGSIASAQASPAPTVSISANPMTVTIGERSRITWSSTNATSCAASGGNWTGEKPLSDSKNTGQITYDVSFQLTCTGPGGSATNEVKVAVAAPTISITANPSTVTSGSRTLIRWSTTNATACTASGAWTGAKPLSDAKNTGWMLTDSVFGLTCTGPGGTASRTATVTVVAAPPTGVATLSWSPPTKNTNGTPVVALAGYHVYYGNLASALTKSVAVSGGNTSSLEISGLPSGTWYFAVAADASDGTQGPQSVIGSLSL